MQALASHANWLLVKAPELRARLAPYGIVVRDCTSFGMPGTVRIAVPDEDGLSRLDQALTDLNRHSQA
jgi:histidinol-phosphate/aromatic aminotransferase/cobyric acid decarboxylase-like protein